MSRSHHPADFGDPPFWDQFLAALQRRQIKQGQQKWYALRVEQYISHYHPLSLQDHSPQQLTPYLTQSGRNGRLKDWQFGQVVDALNVLFVDVLALPWARDFDWGYWRDTVRKLGSDHPTVARDIPTKLRARPVDGHGRVSGPDSANESVIGALATEIRRRAYSIRTEQAYTQWVRRYISFFDDRNPRTLGGPEVTEFLERLVIEGNVAASTQNQALNALVFLCRHVLEQPLEKLDSFARAKRPHRLPVVLTRAEVRALLGCLDGVQWLMASLLYGAGMPLMECVRLRVKDVDFAYQQILIRDAKGRKDRVALLPRKTAGPLRAHLGEVRILFEGDKERGFGEVYLPEALARKWPKAPRE